MKPYNQRNKRLERIRFFFSNLLDKSSKFCWADLAMFGMGYGFKHLFKNSVATACKSESLTHDCQRCYCGKFYKGELVTKEMVKQWELENPSKDDDLPF